MTRSATQIAGELLQREAGGIEELRVHAFADDVSAHDDDQIQHLYADFSATFDRVCRELVGLYGRPSSVGEEDDELIPLCGVFRFALWNLGGRTLFAAATHEDRGVPIVLVLGTAAGPYS